MEVVLMGAGMGLIKAIEGGLVSRSVAQLFRVMDSLTSHPVLDDELTKLDIVAKMKTVGALLDQLTQDLPEELKEDQAASIALHYCVDIIDKIRLTLQRLEDETAYHNTMRWLPSLRNPQYGADLEMLRTYKAVLEQRVDLFVQILTIQRARVTRKAAPAARQPAPMQQAAESAPTAEAPVSGTPDEEDKLVQSLVDSIVQL